ncbi:MAG TPA: hypothetical protein VFK88_06690 [Gallionella sp.]|nr:hypothetical protein [Gallionella sp.]
MAIARAGLLLILTLSLHGCATYQIAYFKPIGPGSYSKSQCGGPDYNLFVHLDKGLALTISTVGMRGDGRRSISVGVHLGKGHIFQLASSNITLINNEGQRVVLPLKDFSYFETDKSSLPYTPVMHSFPSTAVLDGADAEEGSYNFLNSEDEKNREYITHFDVDEVKWEKFRLEIPSVFFDGKKVSIPEIRFELRNETVINYIC